VVFLNCITYTVQSIPRFRLALHPNPKLVVQETPDRFYFHSLNNITLKPVSGGDERT
jgi:hypothetical protein